MTPPSVTIRRLTAEDAQAYRAIRLAGLKEAPDAFASTHEHEEGRSLDQFAQRVIDFPIFGAFIDAQIVGTAGYYRETSPKERHKGMLWGIYVAPEARGFRVGQALVQAALDHAAGEVEQVRLVVSHGNAAAVGLYERLGFVTYGHEPRALKGVNGYSDDVLMVKFLGDAP